MEEQYLIGLVCFIVGALVVYLWKQQTINLLQRQNYSAEQDRERLNTVVETKEQDLRDLREKIQTSETEKAGLLEKLNQLKTNDEFLSSAKEQMQDTFNVLATKALDETSQKFRQVAEDDTEKRQKAVAELVNPIRETLGKLENRTEKLADERKASHTQLETVISKLLQFSHQAQDEVRKLSQAMSQSQTRGSWGEYVLEQILKFSGLQENTHYDKQTTLQIEDRTQRARPDYIIKLPNGRKLVVDAKTSFKAFEDAAMTEDENTRIDLLKKHAEQVQEQMDKLARTDYLPFIQENYGETATPDYVVMFLPSDALYHAALEQSPKLAQVGFDKRVILTSPTTFFALIGVINLGFREDAIAAEAEEINKRGNELYKRSIKLVEFISNIGTGLSRSVDSYNNAIGSLNRMYIPQVERFKELDSIVGGETPELREINENLRQPRLLGSNDNQNMHNEDSDGIILSNT